jgi:hypothetical protein
VLLWVEITIGIIALVVICIVLASSGRGSGRRRKSDRFMGSEAATAAAAEARAGPRCAPGAPLSRAARNYV